MSEKLAEVYERYNMEILSTRKGRGATIVTTTEGLRILEPFRGSVTRLEQEHVLKQLFLKEGFANLDYLIPNRDGQLFTCDKYRQPFVLKKHFEGEECDMHNPSDIIKAVKTLASFHIYGKKVALEFGQAWCENQREEERKRIEEIKQAVADGEELEKIAYVYEISQSVLEEVLREQKPEKLILEDAKDCRLDEVSKKVHLESQSQTDIIKDIFIRHNKELKKIQRFVSKVKRKNNFENLFLRVFNDYWQQGIQCVQMLEQMEIEKQRIPDESRVESHYGICHGAFNQHNIILGTEETAIVHFERFSKGNQLNDLYQFARKVMEKNHFDYSMLNYLLEIYGQKITLDQEDYRYIYILFSYPEKFWKIANSYYNTNKAFLSPKYTDKLETVILQEEEKRKMLEQYRMNLKR